MMIDVKNDSRELDGLFTELKEQTQKILNKKCLLLS